MPSVTSAPQFQEMRRGEDGGDQEKCCKERSEDLEQEGRRPQGCGREDGQEGRVASAQIGHRMPSQGAGLAMVGSGDRGCDPLRRDLRGGNRRGASGADACGQSPAERGRRRSRRGRAEGRACGRQAAHQGRRTRPPARRARHRQGKRRLRRPAELQRRTRQQGPRRAVRLACGAQPQEGWCDRHRPHQHAGILLPRLHRQSAARIDVPGTQTSPAAAPRAARVRRLPPASAPSRMATTSAARCAGRRIAMASPPSSRRRAAFPPSTPARRRSGRCWRI